MSSKDRRVISGIRHDRYGLRSSSPRSESSTAHPISIFPMASRERRAACHGGLKRIEVHDNEVDRKQPVRGGCSFLLFVASKVKKPAMDRRMQGFDPAVENLRRAGEFRNFKRGNAFRLKSVLHRSAGGDDFDSKAWVHGRNQRCLPCQKRKSRRAEFSSTRQALRWWRGRSAGDK